MDYFMCSTPAGSRYTDRLRCHVGGCVADVPVQLCYTETTTKAWQSSCDGIIHIYLYRYMSTTGFDANMAAWLILAAKPQGLC